MKKVVAPFLCLIALSSCVSKKLYTDLETRHNAALAENEKLSVLSQKQQAELARIGGEYGSVKEELDTLREAYKRDRYELDDMRSALLKAEADYDALSSSNKAMLSDAQKKSLSYLEDLEAKQEAISALRDSLNRRENLLAERELRLGQLEQMLSDVQKSLSSLREAIKSALSGFEDKGITISQREGKIYVSLENKLLFASGSFAINSEGKKAIDELAKVLVKQPQLKIMIEGHTDDVPYRTSGQMQDNWDLSVFRATAVVRQMEQTKGINVKNLTAAGRSQYDPVVENSSGENRAKNRRIEVIITPDLSVFEALLNE